MKFEEVLLAFREGKKVRRKDIVWQNYYGFLVISETENKIFSDNADNCDYKITKEDLCTDDWEVVKETKKVKLRDMTEEQWQKWRIKCGISRLCSSCPFSRINCSIDDTSNWFYHKDLYSDKFLDQEVGVEE